MNYRAMILSLVEQEATETFAAFVKTKGSPEVWLRTEKCMWALQGVNQLSATDMEEVAQTIGIANIVDHLAEKHRGEEGSLE